MRAIIEPRPLAGAVAAIPSKSAAHRALICAAFADSPTALTLDSLSADIEATLRCLGELGARYAFSNEGIVVVPVPPEMRRCEDALLDCGESGSTLRFMLPVACALGGTVSFTGAGRLAERPLSPLYEELQRAGMELSEQGSFPLTALGELADRSFTVAGNISSQFVTGLLLAAPQMGGATVRVTEPVESKPYIDLTLQAMRAFGVSVEKTQAEGAVVFHVPEGGYVSPGSLAVEGDWSNAAFWLAAGALGSGPVAVDNLLMNSTQGDRAVLAALTLFGAQVARGANHASVIPAPLHAAHIDCRDIPDLVPALAAVAACAEGTSRLTGIERLMLKESNRIATVAETLNALGARIIPSTDQLVIEGVHTLAGGTVDSHNDHRIAMMAAIASVRSDANVIIEDARAVAKSYPDFFDDFAALGGAVALEGE